MYFGYVDFTNDANPFYVGIGNLKRVQNLLNRNQKHTHVCKHRGQKRQIWFQSSDWIATQQWEISTIQELKTFHLENNLGCNFTRGGDGTVGWKPSLETRAKWSLQRIGNTWSRGPRLTMQGKPKPWITQSQKGRKRPDLALIASGKKRGKYSTTPESRFKQGASNRGKQLSEEHRSRISNSQRGKIKTISEFTREKMRKPRSLEVRERMRLAAIERWKKWRHERDSKISTDPTS
jgi:hypothetical protein